MTIIEVVAPGMRQCEICGKGSRMGGRRVLLRGHYNPTVSMRKYPNLQKTRLADGAKVLSCTQCMKKLPPKMPKKK